MNAIERVTQWKVNHPVFLGIAYAFLWMTLGALTLSVMLYSSSTSEADMMRYIYMIHAIALFIGGWISGRRSSKKGWYYGGITGLCYTLLVLLIAFLAMDAGLNATKLVLGVIAFGIGSLGGMIGVNMRKPAK